MKSKMNYLAGLFLLSSFTLQAQDTNTALRPIGAETANPHAVAVMQNLLNQHSINNPKLRIVMGEKGDKSVRKYKKFIPQQAEGFYLACNDQEIVVAGSDERGTFYGVQTLARLMEGDARVDTAFSDYPLVAHRGVVEGFYGSPWSHQARLRQIDFYGKCKMNTYIYGPKNDPYHSSPNWRKPYPEKEAKQLKEIVAAAQKNEVDFVWAIHPGQDIRWNQEDRDALLDKFEKMYELGVRAFAVFFDDIIGEGTNAQKQAELLNYIDEQFVKQKPDVRPLIMCPTEYNKSWAKPSTKYLPTLGEVLNPTIQIMWTGDRVVADIKEEGLKWVNEQIKRPAYIWWNFPVSDYVRDHLLMGPVYGNDKHIANEMSGFVTNPMEYAEASKIAIYGVAEYAWNPTRYNEDKAWEDAIRAILPDAPEALRCFAMSNSDLGANGHDYRREESTDIEATANRFLRQVLNGVAYEKDDMQALRTYVENFIEAADILLTSQSNRPLIEEMKPWIYQFKLTGQMGIVALDMLDIDVNKQQDRFMRKYNHLKSLQRQLYQNDQTYNQNKFQPGAKTASKVIKPMIDQLFFYTVSCYNKANNASLEAAAEYAPHKLTSDVEQLKRQPIQVRTNRVVISPALEVIQWPAGKQVLITLNKVYTGKSVLLNFGTYKPCEWGKLEVSADGKNWKEFGWKQRAIRMTADLKNEPIKFIRFTNIDSAQQNVYFRQFEVAVDEDPQ